MYQIKFKNKFSLSVPMNQSKKRIIFKINFGEGFRLGVNWIRTWYYHSHIRKVFQLIADI